MQGRQYQIDNPRSKVVEQRYYSERNFQFVQVHVISNASAQIEYFSHCNLYRYHDFSDI